METGCTGLLVMPENGCDRGAYDLALDHTPSKGLKAAKRGMPLIADSPSVPQAMGSCHTHQSMVVQLTRPGNMRQRSRKVSPTGLRHRMTCRLVRTRSRKKE